ncbi:MAG: glucosamine-6-phosphate deaminase [Eubacteriales bacterium]
MRVIVCENYEEMSKAGARIFAAHILLYPEAVLGLATGSTPVGLYRELVKLCEAGEIDFSGITTFNLDEYYPISPENPQSYRYFMNENLFDHVNIDKSRTHVPNGMAADSVAECAGYDQQIKAAGGIDLQLLGIGLNGHIGFNEPDGILTTGTHVTELTESTIEANSRFFESREEVPTRALTMGMETILHARKIVLLANGAAKHPAVKQLLDHTITTHMPATLLKVHPDVTLICDRAAYEG